MNGKRHPRYASFLLRLWQVKEKESLAWRASLESPASGKIQGFPNPQTLLAFLQVFMETETPPEGETGNGTLPEEK
ncbi:MAG: hypothetical protein ACOYYS_20415 [Chloroflexota bacterium]